MIILDKILELAQKNLGGNSFAKQKDAHQIYFQEISDELKEVKAEYRRENVVHLEDELGDVLWDYIMCLKTLEKDGYIRSFDNVLEHAFEKYAERLAFLDNPDLNYEGYWKEVKERQKKRLKDEHDQIYKK